jgi:hypothetical protein
MRGAGRDGVRQRVRSQEHHEPEVNGDGAPGSPAPGAWRRTGGPGTVVPG